jgi:uncharacterized membrane protein YgcG
MGRSDWWWRAALIVLAWTRLSVGQEPEIAPPLTAQSGEASEQADPNIDILARGPVHEAYAEQASPNATPGVVVPKAPPEPVNEVPPDWKPEGDDVEWIPGYWFWDEDRSDYVWVSGVWRRVPPDRRWVPGYWQATDSGYQWVSGFWAPVEAAAVEYAEAPPESLESGPSSPAPSDDYFWIPGNWEYSVTAYRWRPGYWHPYRDDWAWVSARYLWTPRGCVFVPGYWDYTLARRGFLFAPIYYRRPLYLSVGYYYRPSCWIGTDALLMHLFVQPNWHHLYFGDYYGPAYWDRHYVPCYDYYRHYPGFASLYVYYQHHYHRQGIDYCARVRDWHDHYVRHEEFRPPHTYHPHDGPDRHGPDISRGGRNDIVVHPAQKEKFDGGERIGGHRIEHVAAGDEIRLKKASGEFRDLARQRGQFEKLATPAGGMKLDHADRKTTNLAHEEKFVLPHATNTAERKRPMIKPLDSSGTSRLPLASDGSRTGTSNGNNGLRLPDGNPRNKKGTGRGGDGSTGLTTDVPKLKRTLPQNGQVQLPDGRRGRDGSDASGLLNGSTTTQQLPKVPRPPLAKKSTGTTGNSSGGSGSSGSSGGSGGGGGSGGSGHQGSNPNRFTPPTTRKGTISPESGSHGPDLPGSGSRSRGRSGPPSSGGSVSSATGGASGRLPLTLPPDVSARIPRSSLGSSSPRAELPAFRSQSPSVRGPSPSVLGQLPSARNQLSGTRGPLHATGPSPSLSSPLSSSSAAPRLTPPPAVRGLGGGESSRSSRSVFTPPSHNSFQRNSGTDVGRGRGAERGGSGSHFNAGGSGGSHSSGLEGAGRHSHR